MMLEELRLIDEQIGQLGQDIANLLSQHLDKREHNWPSSNDFEFQLVGLFLEFEHDLTRAPARVGYC
jgi:hypothetical protein